jgi:pimeloyl-ACP methyl ester carboxylesterase
VTDKSVRTKHTELRYSITGRGPAVLSIQGVGVAGSGWQPQVAALSGQFTLISFDNCGVGRSPRGSHPLTIERMALDALAIADVEHAGRFHLLGHSMGGLIAQHIALTARERIRSLSLVCTFANGADATRLSTRLLALGLRSRIGTRAIGTRRSSGRNLEIYLAAISRTSRPSCRSSCARCRATARPVAWANSRGFRRSS